MWDLIVLILGHSLSTLFVMFNNGYIDLSASIIILDMVFVLAVR